MAGPTLLVRWGNFEAQAIELAGFAAGAHLRAHGYPINPEPGWSRMPWAVIAAMWKAAERRTRDANLGLHAAAKVSLAHPGFIPYAMLSAANLRETFAFLEEHQRLLIDNPQPFVTLEERRRHDAICLQANLEPAPSKHHAEFLLLLFTRAGRHILGEGFAPAALHLRRTVPPRASEFVTAFSCPVYWDQQRDELLIDVEIMLRPSPYAHPETMRMMRERAAHFVQQYTAPDWKARVTALVERMLPDGDAVVDRVAKNLGISPRTLQRRLADEGSSFDEIRNAVRRTRALELVGKDRVPVARVADQLGFSDARAFRRAFRRWTGTSPSGHADDKLSRRATSPAATPAPKLRRR